MNDIKKTMAKMTTSNWMQALKEYSITNGSYLIPKKGTPEYNEVMVIVDRLKGTTHNTTKPIMKIDPLKQVATIEVIDTINAGLPIKKARKPRIKKLAI